MRGKKSKMLYLAIRITKSMIRKGVAIWVSLAMDHLVYSAIGSWGGTGSVYSGIS